MDYTAPAVAYSGWGYQNVEYRDPDSVDHIRQDMSALDINEDPDTEHPDQAYHYDADDPYDYHDPFTAISQAGTYPEEPSYGRSNRVAYAARADSRDAYQGGGETDGYPAEYACDLKSPRKVETLQHQSNADALGPYPPHLEQDELNYTGPVTQGTQVWDMNSRAPVFEASGGYRGDVEGTMAYHQTQGHGQGAQNQYEPLVSVSRDGLSQGTGNIATSEERTQYIQGLFSSAQDRYDRGELHVPDHLASWAIPGEVDIRTADKAIRKAERTNAKFVEQCLSKLRKYYKKVEEKPKSGSKHIHIRDTHARKADERSKTSATREPSKSQYADSVSSTQTSKIKKKRKN